MFTGLIRKIIGTRNDRLIKEANQQVRKINALEETMKAMSDEELQGQTALFRERLKNGEPLDNLLPEAFATMREASSRVLGMRHYDVQMIGGITLHHGRIAEMRTGEGKTLVATLAVYLNALTGKGVHVVTVNDYLARRDAEWMGRVYNFLGLSVGVVYSGQSQEEKKAAYQADIAYCTNNELGFDYLRDNMVYSLEQKVQRPHYFAVIDEVDSILIDEARTPLIISGPVEGSEELYIAIDKLVPYLDKPDEDGPVDFEINEKDRQVTLTEVGHEKIEGLLIEAGLLNEGESLYDNQNLRLYHHLDNCLRAHYLFHRDVDYIVAGGEIVIVDEHTGRTLKGRRWSDGLHQAIEVKESVEVKPENQTLASITFQNYFRIYEKLSGMTGTADTEAPEFLDIYGLEVVVIPTNRPIQRKDLPDRIYLTQDDKYSAILRDIAERHEKGQPVLVGTASVEVSELISELLTQAAVPHEVLNAKQHEREAYIVGKAGMPGAITIATNMAGRGTDIVLGGNFEMELEGHPDATEAEIAELRAEWQKRHDLVLELGGLHIVGTERHESRRIDNQLRGRAGRQGDAGSSRFYLSLEDHLLRIFTSPRAYQMMKNLGLRDGEHLEHKWINRTIENAQRKVEGHNYEIRKNLLQYDDVANDQRKIIYQQRDDLLAAENVSSVVDMMRQEVLGDVVEKYIPAQSYFEQWDLEGLEADLLQNFNTDIDLKAMLKENPEISGEEIAGAVIERNAEIYNEKLALVDRTNFSHFEKSVMLEILDNEWKRHLAAMDYLRQGIQLRAYGQRRPEHEYKKESFELFVLMLDEINKKTLQFLSHIQIKMEPEVAEETPVEIAPKESEMTYLHGDEELNESEELSDEALKYAHVGRNDDCPCGSGRKFKHCHGRLS